MSDPIDELPKTFRVFSERYPALVQAQEQIAASLDTAGPLDEKTRALIKLGICLGAGLQSAVRSHVRRSLEMGIGAEEIEHALVLGMNSVGFPKTVAAWQWAQDLLGKAVSDS